MNYELVYCFRNLTWSALLRAGFLKMSQTMRFYYLTTRYIDLTVIGMVVVLFCMHIILCHVKYCYKVAHII